MALRVGACRLIWSTFVVVAAIASLRYSTRWPYPELVPLHAAIVLAIPWLVSLPANARISLVRAICGLAILCVGIIGVVNGRPSAVKAKAGALGLERTGWLVRNPVGYGPDMTCIENPDAETRAQLIEGLRLRRRAWGARAVRLAEHLGLPLSGEDHRAGSPIVYGCLSRGKIEDIRCWMEDERRCQRAAEQLRERVLAAATAP